jgi:hypothetical protein
MLTRSPQPQAGVELPAAYRRYLLLVVAGLVVYVLVGAAINFWMDPWEVWRPLPAYRVIPRGTNYERATIPNNIRNAAPFEVLLLGSSRVGPFLQSASREVDPAVSAPFFGQRRVFRANLAGTNIYTMSRILEHALHYHPVNEVLLLTDDVMLNVYRPNGAGWQERNYFGSSNYQTTVERVLSLADFSMLQASLGLIAANLHDSDARPAEPPPGQAEIAARVRADAIARIEEFRRRDLYGCLEITQKPREELGRFLEVARQSKVRVTVVSAFIHPALFEFSYRSDDGRAQRDYVEALKEAADRYGVATWFISPFSPIAYGAPRSKSPGEPDFEDVGHTNPEMAALVLNRVLKGIEHTGLLAYRLNDVAVDDVVAAVRTQREQWLQAKDLPFADYLKANPLIARSDCPRSRG